MRPGLAAAVLAAVAALAAPGCAERRADPKAGLRSGSGYVVLLPPGWRDVSEERRAQISQSFDKFFAGGHEGGFETNVNVLARARPDDLALPAIASRARSEVRHLGKGVSEITRPRPRHLDGEAALAYDYRLQHRDPALRGRTVLALHRGRLYLVTLTTAAGAFESARPRFERLLAGWQWD